MKTVCRITVLGLMILASVVIAQNSSSFVDKRDGKTYRAVVIGEQAWMAENLNNEGSGKCYDNAPSNCAKYGRLYTWEEARVACPAGWRLPKDAEWTALENAVGGSGTAGKQLKANTGWAENGNGTDGYGFAALPGGYGSMDGSSFHNAGNDGNWWSATHGSNFVYGRSMSHDKESVYRGRFEKPATPQLSGSWNSVRCVQNR